MNDSLENTINNSTGPRKFIFTQYIPGHSSQKSKKNALGFLRIPKCWPLCPRLLPALSLDNPWAFTPRRLDLLQRVFVMPYCIHMRKLPCSTPSGYESLQTTVPVIQHPSPFCIRCLVFSHALLRETTDGSQRSTVIIFLNDFAVNRRRQQATHSEGPGEYLGTYLEPSTWMRNRSRFSL